MIQLRKHDRVETTWAEGDALVRALEQFWANVLFDVQFDQQFSGWQLSGPGFADVQVPRDTDRRVLAALAVRRSEPGFLRALAVWHAQAPARALDCGPVLALAPSLPAKVEQMVTVLRRALDLTTQAVHHLGRIDEGLPRPEGAVLCLTTRSAAYANGAGTMTDFEEWHLDVLLPEPLRLQIEASDEYGSETRWSIAVHHTGARPVAPLLDAFKEAGLWVRESVTPGLRR